MAAAARKAPPLRAVGEGEKRPAAARRLSVTQAAQNGSQLELLVAMRARIAQTVEDPKCPPRDLASLSRRLQDINREIEALETRRKQEALEDGRGAEDEEWDPEAL